MNQRSGPRRWVAAGIAAAMFCALAVSRAWVAPKYLYYFDSVNFALALEDFNPALHQPQPPGYPLFVLFAKLISFVTPSAQATFVTAGILASAIAMYLTWRLGREMFGARAGLCAVMLLLFSPPFWFGGVTNQVRVFLAVGGAAVALAIWRSLHESRAAWFYAAAALVGAMSGFRPEILAFAAPLLVYGAVRGRWSLAQWSIAAAIAAVAAGAWIAFVLNEVGGPSEYIKLIGDYSSEQFSGSSAVFGAASQSARRMLWMAGVWYGLPLLVWLPFAPFAHGALSALRPHAAFFATAVLPAVLFHSIVHVGDPDHTLFAVPMLCVAGGLVLSRVRAPALATAAATGLSLIAFFAPPKGIAQACSYRAVRHIDQLTRGTFSEIESLRRSGPLTLVAWDHEITWRNLSYYFPDVPVLVLREDPRSAAGPQSAWLIVHRRLQQPVVSGDAIVLPAGSRTIWLLSKGRGMHELLQQGAAVNMASPLAYSDVQPGANLRFGRYRFTASGM